MVHLNVSAQLRYEKPEVHNDPCQHAFVLVGEEQVFAVHMTQFHTEKHKYQMILHVELDEDALKEYRHQRKLFPDDTFILCNRIEDKCSVPQLGGGLVKKFTGAIYRGFRPPAEDPPPEDWFPWNDKDTLSVAGLGPIDVIVKRVVFFRPFSHIDPAPPYANYLMWGGASELLGGPYEVHMTNFQTAGIISDRYSPPVYGLDVDHVFSLTERPEWVSDDMLTAGINVSVPAIPRYNPETGQTMVLPAPPWKEGDHVQVMYRGEQPARAIVAGKTFFWGSFVVNSEGSIDPESPEFSAMISPMPKIYWK